MNSKQRKGTMINLYDEYTPVGVSRYRNVIAGAWTTYDELDFLNQLKSNCLKLNLDYIKCLKGYLYSLPRRGWDDPSKINLAKINRRARTMLEQVYNESWGKYTS